MSRLANFFVPKEFYHLYNRGVEKRPIFISNSNKDRFLSLLYLCNSNTPIHRSDYIDKSLPDLLVVEREKTLVDIGAYCLMPNHFHLLIHERIEKGISTFMQKLATAYTMYFNKLNERDGALFQGNFKAEHLTTDNYLKYIFAYIHLNPIGIIDRNWKQHEIKSKKAAIKFLNNYPYSSYLDYINNGSRYPEGNILDKSAFPEYFLTPKDFRSHLQDWLDLAKECHKECQGETLTL